LPEMFLIFLIANIPANKSQIIKRWKTPVAQD
jgi:hypothetical protein